MVESSEVLSDAVARLAFLVAEHGLTQSVEYEEWATKLRYLAEEIGFEVNLDWHDQGLALQHGAGLG